MKINGFSKKTAFSLFITLVCVILITLFMVSLLQSVSNENNSTRLYTTSMDLSRMSDSAVSLVQAQITAATSQSRSGRNADAVSWASQPGMIRTYTTGGSLWKAFKLYSWDTMIEDDDFDPVAEEQFPPSDWADQPALFTDLNEPSNSVYPIIDPRVQDSVIEGFDVDSSRVDFLVGSDEAPMPVKWLYVLQDGTISIATAGDAEASARVSSATLENPIVGRIAFWTDDESTKLNVNTASEGTYWDMPRTAGPQDAWEGDFNGPTYNGFSTSLPVYDEYQRVPGHPATTSLSSVFGDPTLLPTMGWTTTELHYNLHRPYYGLTPRIAAGGSEGGQKYIEVATEINLTLDPDRLYASVGELLFSPGRETDTEGHDVLSPDIVSRRQFFLTTASRSPEENLFNKPRVSLWPLQDDETQSGVRNAKDHLLAFVSELGKDDDGKNLPYHFQRHQAYLSSNNVKLPAGVFGSAHSMTDDLTKVQRNQELLNYLFDAANTAVPGYGASLAAKYPQDIEQIILNSFDYVRSGVNTVNQALTPRYNYTVFNPEGQNNDVGRGFVMPIRGFVNGLERQGFGRASVIKEFALGFHPSQWRDTHKLGTKRIAGLDFDEDGNLERLAYPIWVKEDFDFPDEAADFNLTIYDTLEKRIDERIKWLADWDNVLEKEADGLPDDVPEIRVLDEALSAGNNYKGYNRIAVAHYDGVGDPQTKAIGMWFLINPVVLNAGPPEVYNSVRYRVSGLDNIPIEIENDEGDMESGRIRGPAPNQSVMTIRGTHQASQGEMGFFDIIMKPAQHHSRGKQLAYSDGITGNTGRNDPEINKFPWFSDEAGMFVLDGYAPPSDWKLNGKGVHVKREFDRVTYGAGGGAVTADQQVERPKMTFGPVTIKVEVFPSLTNNFTDADLIQEYTVTFPQQRVPVPQVLRANPSQDLYPGGEGDGKIDNQYQGDPSNDGFLAFSEAGDLDETETFIERPEEFRMDASEEQARFQRDFYYGFLRHPIPQKGAGDHSAFDLNPLDLGTRFLPEWHNSFGTIIRPDTPKGVPSGGRAIDSRGVLLRAGDVIRSMVPTTSPGNDSPRGDLRLYLMRKSIPEEFYEPGTNYTNEDQFTAHSIIYRSTGNVGGFQTFGHSGPDTANLEKSPMDWLAFPINEEGRGQLVERDGSGAPVEYSGHSRAAVSTNMTAAYMRLAADDEKHVGDFDTGQANMRDGPWLNKPDEAYARIGGYANVYFPHNYPGIYGERIGITYSPNRQIASPVIMGSLPTGVWSMKPWQTLLFNPIPAAGDVHPGHGSGTGAAGGPKARAPFTVVPDHVFLDMFFMPVAEPYPISERFSTAGKINMNYAMMPFPHIQRNTGIHAVLKNAKVMAIPNAAVTDSNGGKVHKAHANWANTGAAPSFRYDINAEQTLEGFEERFYGGQPDLFRSASEITRIYMVPQEPAPEDGFRWKTPSEVYTNANLSSTPGSYENTPGWWDKFLVTGDNAREAVYNHIYPRLTTKSNTFRVHYRVQTLQKRRAGEPIEWIEGVDRVMGEMRGSALIERYIDPNAQDIPDYATDIDPTPLHSYYRWRVVSEQQFRP